MAHKRTKTKGAAKIEMRGETRYRSRTLRRVQRVTPGGRTVVHYNYKSQGKHTCAICGDVLLGKPRGKPFEIAKLSKSERKPERPFGGMLCSPCSRRIMKLRAQLKGGLIKQEEVPISLRGYVPW